MIFYVISLRNSSLIIMNPALTRDQFGQGTYKKNKNRSHGNGNSSKYKIIDQK